MVKQTILYVISPRSALSIKPGRKISTIIDLWKKSYEVIPFFGGDILYKDKKINTVYGNYTGNEKAYRKSKLLEPLIHTVSEIKDIIHNFKSYNFFKENYAHKDIDLVWERSSRFHFAGLLYAKKYNIPYVLEWKDHLIPYKYSLLKPFALLLERYKCNKADKIVVESKVLKDMLSGQGIDKSKIDIAYNAVDSNEFTKDRKIGSLYKQELNISSDTIVIGYLGSYAFYHDTMRLILAAEILKQRGYENKIKFLLVGNGKDYLQCLESAKEKDLLDNIMIIKQSVPKEEVPRVLSAIDISILPGSTDIICPIKVLEYMASSTAVILPQYECNEEVVVDGKNGIFFKPKDEVDLADKIEMLLLDKDKIEILSNNARQTTIEKFSWENTWGECLNQNIKNIANEN
jgi:glycosyltransferase involved in cell wall biosynthesis